MMIFFLHSQIIWKHNLINILLSVLMSVFILKLTKPGQKHQILLLHVCSLLGEVCNKIKPRNESFLLFYFQLTGEISQ